MRDRCKIRCDRKGCTQCVSAETFPVARELARGAGWQVADSARDLEKVTVKVEGSNVVSTFVERAPAQDYCPEHKPLEVH